MSRNEKLSVANQFKMPIVFLVLFAVWAFMTFSGWLAAFDSAGVDLFRTSAEDPIGPAWFEKLVIAITHVGDSITLIIVSVVGLALLGYSREKRNAIIYAGMVGGIFALTPILKALFGRARPDIVEHLVHASSASFPSGHALRSAVVYLAAVTAWRLYRGKPLASNAKALVMGLIISIGASRVYLGVHWPSDIIAGWFFAGFWFLLWAPLFRKAD